MGHLKAQAGACHAECTVLGCLCCNERADGLFLIAACASFAVQVPSLVEGGAFWFPDLTVADPYYLLPVLSSLTFLLTVELGAETGMEGQVKCQA